ncbi:MAG: 4-hydroxythreonine-4-phosphate dehydrogenase PdxA [Candidatus Omnitrophica bacterium]|nr:4-hydroxythreonine-4-phosphate dehydrogenase PdxA [Candidatus Omnitrophota bacterium]
MKSKIKIGITIGDPSGIGPEITLKALRKFNAPRDCEILVFADKVAFKQSELKSNMNKFNLIDLDILKKGELKQGVLSKKFGSVSLSYLKKAVEYLKQGRINCLVTAPVSKKAISLNGVGFCGHTEFLAEEFAVRKFVMMFVSEKLKLSLVTRHIALKDVSKQIKKEDVFNVILLTYDALRNNFGIKQPRMAVSALNPHGPETGKEEGAVIKPAIEKFINIYKTKNIHGPLPADTIFNRVLNKELDAVVCMYHDQGLIPFKMLCFSEGVNLTLGLPFVRTSPVHGTAFDIAGKNKADCSSMLAAIKLAYTLTKNKLKD